MGISGEIKYEGFKVYLQLANLGLHLSIPMGELGGIGGISSLLAMSIPPVGITMSLQDEEQRKFLTLITGNMEAFRQFLDEALPRDIAMQGIMVLEGGATVTSLGEITFEGETRRPTFEDYQDLDKLIDAADAQAKINFIEHCKTCPTCAEAAGLPPITHMWNNGDDEVH